MALAGGEMTGNWAWGGGLGAELEQSVPPHRWKAAMGGGGHSESVAEQ